MNIKDSIAMLDLTIRVYCLEKILIEKGIFSKEELAEEVNAASEKAMKDLMEKIQTESPSKDDSSN